jgi:glutamine cyclotransferase
VNRLFLCFTLALSGCTPQAQTAQPDTAPVTQIIAAPSEVRQLSWSIARAFPHDTAAFTQGLLWKDGRLFESTGLEGKSEIREVDAASGQVLRRFKLPSQFFGEGLAFLDGKFFYLTWQSKVGFVFDSNFKPLARFSYQNEGWGLTTDGKRLLQSDGSDVLTWRDPKNFASIGQIRVTRNGAPLRNLNELEWIRGYVWANVWQTDQVVVINPKNGKVVAQLDLSGLLKTTERNGREDVLNGIAYDAQNGRIFVTGKKWPKLFWLQVDNVPSQ